MWIYTLCMYGQNVVTLKFRWGIQYDSPANILMDVQPLIAIGIETDILFYKKSSFYKEVNHLCHFYNYQSYLHLP